MKFIDESEVFAVNPQRRTQVVHIDQHRYYVQVDDFYTNPQQVADLAHSIPPSTSSVLCNGLPTNSYSGRINATYDLHEFTPVLTELIQKYYPNLRTDQSLAHSLESVSFMCNVMCSLELPAREPHIDHPQDGFFAATIGLVADQHCQGGTAFYTPKLDTTPPHEYVTDTTQGWQLDHIAQLAWNRLVIYPTNYWHTPYIKPTWYTSPDNLRVTQQFFI